MYKRMREETMGKRERERDVSVAIAFFERQQKTAYYLHLALLLLWGVRPSSALLAKDERYYF